MNNNLMYYTNDAIIQKKFINGLSSYTQTNCQVTLTDQGYRIYRPPNKTTSADGNTMWGGLKIVADTSSPDGTIASKLIKGHSYIMLWDVKGQSSQAQGSYTNWWSNQMGWSGGGLMSAPANVASRKILADFQTDTWQTFFYKWDLTDDVYKVCTSSYGSFVQGQTYLSYKHFGMGWEYGNTGTLGTDIYIRNIRMYDITDINNPRLYKNGVFSINNFLESEGNINMKKMELTINSFIEI